MVQAIVKPMSFAEFVEACPDDGKRYVSKLMSQCDYSISVVIDNTSLMK